MHRRELEDSGSLWFAHLRLRFVDDDLTVLALPKGQ